MDKKIIEKIKCACECAGRCLFSFRLPRAASRRPKAEAAESVIAAPNGVFMALIASHALVILRGCSLLCLCVGRYLFLFVCQYLCVSVRSPVQFINVGRYANCQSLNSLSFRVSLFSLAVAGMSESEKKNLLEKISQRMSILPYGPKS